MSTTLAGAFKAYIETLGTGFTVCRDGATVISRSVVNGKTVTKTIPLPYIVVQDGIGVTPSTLGGDFGDLDAETFSLELLQIDVFQAAREQISPTRTKVTERPDVVALLRRALRGTGVRPWAPYAVDGHRIQGEQRWPVSANVARHTFTVEVSRSDLYAPPSVSTP